METEIPMIIALAGAIWFLLIFLSTLRLTIDQAKIGDMLIASFLSMGCFMVIGAILVDIFSL